MGALARNQAALPGLNPVFLFPDGFEAMTSTRAMRYRRLALAEEDRAKADLLLKLADECDRGLLCTAEWLSARPYNIRQVQPEEFKAWLAPLC